MLSFKKARSGNKRSCGIYVGRTLLRRGGRRLRRLREARQNGRNLGARGAAGRLERRAADAVEDTCRSCPRHGVLGIAVDRGGVGIGGQVGRFFDVIALVLRIAIEDRGGLGAGLRRRAEDRRREHPPSAHQDRG